MKNNNILFKCFMLLVLAVGWGSSAWAQTSQLPLGSGVYEILNTSNEGGAGTGRGYLVSYTGHSTGIGLAEVTWSAHSGKHPNQRNSAQTCSYWYLHNHGDGTYTLVSLSTLGGNTVPRFLTVGSNGGKSSIAATPETRLVFRDSGTSGHNRDDVRAVNIANQAASTVFLSAGCGTYSNSGSIMATTNAGDGGCPWMFLPVTSSLTSGQQDILDKYLEHFAFLEDNTTLVFQDGSGNPIDDQVVVYTPASGPEVELTPVLGTYNFGHIPYSPNFFSLRDNSKILDVSYNETQHTLTFTITADPYVLVTSNAPVNGVWAAGTKWFTIHNNRRDKGYLSTQDAGQYLDANATLTIKNGADARGNRGGLWAFVEKDGGFNIYNNAYGPDFILGISGSGGGARLQMYPKDAVPGGVSTLFAHGENSTRDGGASHAYYFNIGLTGNNHLNEQSGYAGTWNPSGTQKTTDGGSAFTVTAIEDAIVNALPAYDVYKVIWTGVSTSDFDISYSATSNVFGRRGSVNDGDYFIVNHGSSIDKAVFNTTGTEFVLGSVTAIDDPAHHYQLLNLFIKDALATEEWTVRVEGGYEVEYQGMALADGGTFFVRPGVAPSALDFTIDAPADKFVWGPVFDAQTKTVSYEVRDLAASLTTGWYQLQLADNASTIATLAGKIKTGEGNINTPANTLYLVPGIYEPDNNRLFKVTGVPTYAGESATFVYIRNNGGGNYTFVHSGNGHELTAPGFTFADGRLTKAANWSYESTAHPLEGPYLLASGGQSMTFNVSPADLSDYDVYQVNIVGSGVLSDVRLQVNNASVLGNKVVAAGGFLFVKKGSNVPVRSQFGVHTGNVTISNFNIGEKSDGVTPLTITVTPRQSLWNVSITGDAKRAEDRVIYNSLSYNDGDMVGVPLGTVPTALDFQTNVTDRFVWGPVIDEKTHTVSFEIKTPVDVTAGSGTPLTTDGWYQFMLVPYTTKGVNFINTINRVSVGAKSRKGSYIYMFNAEQEFEQNSSNHYPMKFAAVPASGDQATSFFYVKANGRNPQFQVLNGHYVHNSGYMTTSPSNMQGMDAINNADSYGQNIYGVYRWSNYDDTGAERPFVGASGTALNYYVRAVKVDPTTMYDVYKVSLPAGHSMVRYVGSDNHGITEVFNNGYFFLTKGAALTKDNFRFEGGATVNSIVISSGNVVSFDVTTPTYGKEIIHRQAYYYDELDTETNLPGEGFIKKGEGMSSREGTAGTIVEQNMAVYEIPVYLKQGTTFTSYMPTDQVKRYQRWYNWDDDGLVDPTVLTSLPDWNVSAANTYDNGHLTGTGYGGFRGDPTLSLPTTLTEYNVGLDMAHYPTRGNIGSGLVEPTLAMRIVYQVRDAKIIAKAIKDKTAAGKFYEVHNIAFPNVKHGNLEDKTIGNLMPLDMDLNNYWIFDGEGETNADLVQLLQSGGAQLEVELGAHSAGAELTNVRMINGTADAASGNIKFSTFNTGHFVLFQYPDGGVVPAGSTATINVYIRKGSGKRYNLAQFNVSFIGNSEPVAVTELSGSYRHPDALAEAFGAPVAELTFDNKTNNEFGAFYKYPLDYKGVSYAFGTMVAGGGHTGWFASRGEYGLGSEYQTSKALGGGNYKYYPVNNYLRNMGNVNASFSAKERDSYCLYIDAADQPGKVASIQLEDALCAGSRLYCYGYIGCTSGGTDQNPTSVLINVMGVNKVTGKEELIYSYCPGIITLRAYDKDNRRIYAAALGRGTVYEPHGDDANYWAPWQQIGFSFAISADIASKMSSYSVQIVNNAWNSDGADTMLDDFEIYVKKPGAEVQNTTPLCSDQIRHIKVITEYNTLIEATGEDINHDGLMSVGFCFLDKEIFDQTLADNAANLELPRTDPENAYNKAFGAALMGNRTLDRTNKDHAFHNFNIIRDGEVSTIEGVTKQRFYTDIPQYSFKESGDDVVYRDSIRGERYVVFKESVAHGEPSSLTAHKWTAGKSYYLLFSTAAISETHVNNHDLGCTVFNLDDNRCAVLYEFTVAPPVSIKGDVEEIISGDEVQACAGQTSTLTVNLNGRTETHDVVIKNLNYDWWLGYISHQQMELENGVPKYYDADGHAIIIPGAPEVSHNTLPATMQNYMNVWWGHYSADHVHLDKHAGERIFLSDAMLEFRRAYPDATDLTDVVPKHAIGDVEEYELTQDMIDCIAHFLQTEPESGLTPLVLSKKEMNLTMTIDKADDTQTYHFVVIPIAPGIYSVDEDAIYCPDPQELKVKLLNAAPTLYNGFDNMTYPASMESVPVRVGLKQIEAVRQVTSGPQRTLSVPVRNAGFAYAEGQFLIKSGDAEIYLVGTDDPAYKTQENVTTSIQDNATLGDIDIDDMFLSAGRVESLAVKRGATNPTMQLTFNHNVIFREGYTYTMKVRFFEVKSDNARDMACEGSFVFDLKVVPEYQVWEASAGNSDWTNDRNWRRADRADLHAGAEATGNGMTGATALNDAASYASNTTNTTAASFVPMYFTNVLLKDNGANAIELYQGGSFKRPALGTRFLEGLATTATEGIVYDMAVTPVNPADRTAFNYDCNYECELFDTYVANGVTFEPGTQMGNAHHLTYNKAWVECSLDADRWYTIASPLKKSVAGDWYSPTAGGKQLTPHFYDINYREDLNDRFRPAYFQRSWDRDGNNIVYTKTGGTYDSYVRADWSNVYNDATVNYSTGGFSVKVELDYMDSADRPADDKVLVRLPKADTSYTYYDVEGETGQAADASIGARTESYRLLSDDLGADGTGSIAMNVSNETADNNFLLLSNPFMAAMDMDEFFAAHPDLEEKYWIVAADRQSVSVRSAADGEWITTGDADGKYVAPLQGFFVKKKDSAPNPGTFRAAYTAAMQTVVNPDPVRPGVAFRAPASRAAAERLDVIRLTAERDGAESTALILLSDQAHDAGVAGEDCEAFIDGNLYAHPTVYTAAGAAAQTINVRQTLQMVPVGMISSDDSPATLRFDLSDSSYSVLYLYDIESDSYTTVNDGSEITMSGNNAGRYFLTTSIEDDIDLTDGDATQQGVWTVSGIYCGATVKGLLPGVYVVDGVKMYVR